MHLATLMENQAFIKMEKQPKDSLNQDECYKQTC